RDDLVTGVQTCALPISAAETAEPFPPAEPITPPAPEAASPAPELDVVSEDDFDVLAPPAPATDELEDFDEEEMGRSYHTEEELQIGRASCREREWERGE